MAEKLQKTGKELCLKGLLSENGRPEIFTKNGKFPAKLRGLESLPGISVDQP